jgi:hypothetical protein
MCVISRVSVVGVSFGLSINISKILGGRWKGHYAESPRLVSVNFDINASTTTSGTSLSFSCNVARLVTLNASDLKARMLAI